MASILGNAGSAVGDGIAGVGKGVGDVGKGVGNGVGEGVGAIGRGVTGATGQPDHNPSSEAEPSPSGSQPSFLAGVGKSGVDFVGKGFSNGFQLAGNISKETLDVQRNVASGIGGMGGTAIDAVVGAASVGTGAVFDPIANGLKSIEGLEALGEGVDQINGLSTSALKGVASITKEALAVAGRPPTFFDPDHDGIVKFEDTKKGFTILGLEEQYAKMAAYALHTTFSFSTSETWDPRSSALAPDMPIRVEKMPQTRWGKNWGNYERIDWVSDADVETFFGMRERQTYAEYFRDSKSYFGTALLIFEWGTTWPFMYGNLFDATSPVGDQLGAIMRAVIIPTITKSHENAKKADPSREDSERPPFPDTDKKVTSEST